MYLVQLLLPLYDADNEPLAHALFSRTRDEIVERFGGLTAYTRAPAAGLWQEENGRQVRDELVIYEVMTEKLDEEWWRQYRRELEQRFRQKELVVRAQEIRML